MRNFHIRRLKSSTHFFFLKRKILLQLKSSLYLLIESLVKYGRSKLVLCVPCCIFPLNMKKCKLPALIFFHFWLAKHFMTWTLSSFACWICHFSAWNFMKCLLWIFRLLEPTCLERKVSVVRLIIILNS